MALTITNQNTLSLLNIMSRTTADQSSSLMRLSTGFKINRGADDPAGMIALQSLNAELTAVDSAIKNGQRANSVLSVADAALNEVTSLLTEIERLAAASTSSGGLSSAELAANQAQIDNAITSIDRIVRTTSFNGKNLLDGNFGIGVSASQANKLQDLRIYSRPSSTTSQSFAVNVVSAGTVASATLASVASTSLSAAEFSVTGNLGTATISIAETDSYAQIVAKIVATAGETGVSASVTSNQIRLQSRAFGDNAFVQATYISGDTDLMSVSRVTGADAAVTINGQNAFVDGVQVSFNNNGTSGEFTLTSAGNVAGSAGTINVKSGGATFQLGTTASTQSTIGISNLFSSSLGDSATGYLSTIKSGGSNDLSQSANNAMAIAKNALSYVARQRGRIGGFQKYQVETAINSLGATKESLTSAKSVINDVDYAAETAELSRLNVLTQSGIALLGVAGQQSSMILSLLR